MVVERNPRDSMKETWRTASRSTWGISEWTFYLLGVSPTDTGGTPPVFKKTDPMPTITDWETHLWILVHAAWPLALQQLYVYAYGKNPATLSVFTLYALAFSLNGILEMRMLKRLGKVVGFLDGDTHPRDQVPDVGTFRVFSSLILTASIRPMFTLFLSYRADQTPLSTSYWWLPVEIGAYCVTLDFWFYWYHRVMHENETLWKFHRTHHLTKHPNALLTLYADHEQEFFDIVGIPLAAWATCKVLGLPMSFYEWWVCHQYVVFTELFGHSGLRAFAHAPSTASPILEFFGCDIRTEDHDLHHRKGWKHSYNYGKQTRLWDKIFGTLGERVEMKPEYVAPGQTLSLFLSGLTL